MVVAGEATVSPPGAFSVDTRTLLTSNRGDTRFAALFELSEAFDEAGDVEAIRRAFDGWARTYAGALHAEVVERDPIWPTEFVRRIEDRPQDLHGETSD